MLQRLDSIPGFLKCLTMPPLAGWYDNPIPARFLAPIDCSKIPALNFDRDEFRIWGVGGGGEVLWTKDESYRIFPLYVLIVYWLLFYLL